MSTGDGRHALAARAELLKLARLLNRDPDQLSYLEVVAADDLKAFREQLTEVLFASSSKTLIRLAVASKLLPTGVVATIAQRAFGPLLAARVAGLLDPGRAVDVAAKLPPDFLADVAIELDPPPRQQGDHRDSPVPDPRSHARAGGARGIRDDGSLRGPPPRRLAGRGAR